MLGENSYEEAFGPASPAPYLAQTLREQGELLSNYYAVTKGDLANQIALLSGQGPTVETAADCPTYTDIVPGTVAIGGQVEGSGCVYPAATPTLPGQLLEKELKWKAYVEDIGNGAAAGAPATCRHPALGGPDSSPAPLPGDAYVTWRNPAVYFHSLLDSPECAEDDVGLDRLAIDLKSEKKTPALSYVVPNACHDGGELPCEPGQPAGPLAAEAFLRDGGAGDRGLARLQRRRPDRDHLRAGAAGRRRKRTPAPAAPAPPTRTSRPGDDRTRHRAGQTTGGGGRVGLLLISPFVAPGTSNESGYYNHFSLLLSIEELFGLEPLGYAAEPVLAPFDSTSSTTRPLSHRVEQQRQLPRLRQQGRRRLTTARRLPRRSRGGPGSDLKATR